jgi:hypothetical protein
MESTHYNGVVAIHRQHGSRVAQTVPLGNLPKLQALARNELTNQIYTPPTYAQLLVWRSRICELPVWFVLSAID